MLRSIHSVLQTLRTASVLAVALVVACATPDTRTAPERAADRVIVSKVEAALAADPYLDTDHMTVSATRGVVRLSGLVADALDLQQVLRICAAVPGVRRVDDQLEVIDFGRGGHGTVR